MQPFTFRAGLPPVDRIDLNSNFREPGQNSYMRETVGYAVVKCVMHYAIWSFNVAYAAGQFHASCVQLHYYWKMEMRKTSVMHVNMLTCTLCHLTILQGSGFSDGQHEVDQRQPQHRLLWLLCRADQDRRAVPAGAAPCTTDIKIVWFEIY